MKVDSTTMALTVASLLVDLGLSHTEAVKALGQARNLLNETKRAQKGSESRTEAFVKVCSWYVPLDQLEAGAELREQLQNLKDPKDSES